jgi:hypothetical protein
VTISTNRFTPRTGAFSPGEAGIIPPRGTDGGIAGSTRKTKFTPSGPISTRRTSARTRSLWTLQESAYLSRNGRLEQVTSDLRIFSYPSPAESIAVSATAAVVNRITSCLPAPRCRSLLSNAVRAANRKPGKVPSICWETPDGSRWSAGFQCHSAGRRLQCQMAWCRLRSCNALNA